MLDAALDDTIAGLEQDLAVLHDHVQLARDDDVLQATK